MRLLYYHKENGLVHNGDEVLLHGDMVWFFGKLKSHFKFRQSLDFRNGKSGGGNCNAYRVKFLSLDVKKSTFVHEIAHALQFKRRKYEDVEGRHWHTKEHMRLMFKVASYFDAHKVEWLEERAKRLSRINELVRETLRRKDIKEALEKTDAYKLKVLKEKEQKALSKLKRMKTRLRKLEASIIYYQKKMEAKQE